MASGTANFKRILKVLDSWPIDKNKAGGRDLGEFLREYVNKAYKENKFETNYTYWDKQFLALKKLVDNTNKKKYPRVFSSSASGLTAEQCNIALSNEFLEELNKEETGFFKKLFSLGPDKDQK